MAIALPAPTTSETTAPIDQLRLVTGLCAALKAMDGCDQVELLETHISFVLLAGAVAYKVKKAVDLGFLDFSTLCARRFFCEEELRLNRRYAPRLYLAVVPITGSAEAPIIGGPGPAIEYAVRMRAFAQRDLGSRVLGRGELQPGHIDALAAQLVAFHGRIDRVAADTALGTPESIRQTARDNFDALESSIESGASKRKLAVLRSWTEREGKALSGTFARRRTEGFVRECHGDLHLDNVALVDGAITPFDGIEFSDRLRWIDVMNEIAFLMMDLEHHGRSDLAWRFLNAYLEQTGDYAGLEVLRFYLVYRAMVRAKIAWLRSTQSDVTEPVRSRLLAEADSHLDLAQSYLRPGRGGIVITHGVSGCGKTTWSQGILEAMGAVRIRSDMERKRLAGMAAPMRSRSALAGGLYRVDITERTYLHLRAMVGSIVNAGYTAIVDATFLKRWQREMFREQAKQQGVPFAIVTFCAPESELRVRIARRQSEGKDPSEADLAVLDYQLASQEVLAPEELVDEIRYDTTGLPDRQRSREAWHPLMDRLKPL